MGMFDWAHCNGPEFVCSEGHDLSGEEFQTKDLDCTLGDVVIEGGRVQFHDSGLRFDGQGLGPPAVSPYTGTIDVGCTCKKCPAFVQAKTFNLIGTDVSFDVEIVNDEVKSVTRTSPSTAEQLRDTPTRPWMAGCYGPVPYETAKKSHIDSKPPPPWANEPWPD